MQLGHVARSSYFLRAVDWTRVHVQNEIVSASELLERLSYELYDGAAQQP